MKGQEDKEGQDERSVREMRITISTGTFIRAILVLAATALIFAVREVVLLVLVGVVIAVAIEPAVRFFERSKIGRFKMPRVGAVAVVYVTGLFLLTLFFYTVVPVVSTELANFLQFLRGLSIPVDTDVVSGISEQSERSVFELVANLRESVTDLSGNIVSMVSSLFGGLLSAVIVFVISFYIAVQRDIIDKFLLLVIPASYSDYAQDLWKRSQRKIGQWIQGQLISALIVGTLVYIGLLIIGVPYALLFAILALVLELIPIIGPVLAAIPAVILAFVGGGAAQGVITIVFYLAVQQLEGNIIYPLVVKRMVGIPSLIVIIAIAIGAVLAGFLGVLLAVPVSAIILEFLSDMRREERGGDTPEELDSVLSGEEA